MHSEGERVSWRGVNRQESGVIEERLGGGTYLVRLDKGKEVIVNEKSIKHD